MKISRNFAAIALLASLACSPTFAQDLACIDKAQTNADFKRIAGKYKGNEKMQETIRKTKQSWEDYRNNQCLFEGTAASGGQTGKPLSLDANKVFLRCAVRTLTEMQAALGKF